MPTWPLTNLKLECYPPVAEHIARPWDAADDYLVNEISPATSTLVINDRHGALACALGNQQTWIDSACAQQAIHNNLVRNNISSDKVEIITYESQINPDCQRVIIKIPKNFAQLKFWLYHCATQLPASTEYWLSGMAKHVPISWLNWLESNSGSYQQYRIEKKARLIRLTQPRCTQPEKTGYQYQTLNLNAFPGVFGHQKLDIGSRVLLPYLSQISSGKVCDLGCGNGLLALLIKQAATETKVFATDDSILATRAAKENARNNQLEITVLHGNCLQAVDEKMDWIVCNPPYHDGHKELTTIARDMFSQSSQQLTPNGRLLVVANRHLPYKKDLQRHFRQVKLLSNDPKFNVFLCAEPGQFT